jgi:tRNA A37 methylthiotransferase MiaB
VHLSWNASQVGKTFEVIVDGPDPEVPNHVQARGHADAPDIDALVRLKGKNLCAGDIVTVKILSVDGYDLVGKTLGGVR